MLLSYTYKFYILLCLSSYFQYKRDIHSLQSFKDRRRRHVVKTLCLVMQVKVLCLGFQKKTQLEISG